MARTLQACLPRSFAWSACREIRRPIPAAARQAAAGARGSTDDASRPLGGNARVHGAGGASAPGHCMVAGMMLTVLHSTETVGFYRLSAAGKGVLKELLAEWQNINTPVTRIVGGSRSVA